MLKRFCFLSAFVIGISACNENQQSANINAIVLLQSQPQKQSKPDGGKEIYLKYCMSCHQKDGSGVPNMFPPLKNSDWVIGDKKRIINIVINGLEGEIQVNGETYSQIMPKQNYLTNKQVAQVLSYLRSNLGNHADSVKVKEVMTLRK